MATRFVCTALVVFLSIVLATAEDFGFLNDSDSANIGSLSTRSGAIPPEHSDLMINFVRKPSVRLGRQQSDTGLNGGLCIRGAFKVTDRSANPVAGMGVTMYSRVPGTGVFKTGKGTTKADGITTVESCFDMPPGSLRLTVQGCIEGNSGLCTDASRLTTRKPVEFQIGFDLGYTIVPDPVGQSNSNAIPIYADNTFAFALWPRLQVNLVEAEHKWKYYRLSLYGTVPYLFQDRSLVTDGTSTAYAFHSIAREANLGDFAAGMNLVLGPRFSADFAYNGRSGKFSNLEAIRTQGQPRPVTYGDGFESIDGTIAVNVPLRARGPVLFAVTSGSHAFPRHFVGGDKATRGDFYQLVTGFAFPGKSGASAFMIWGGYADYSKTLLYQGSETKVTAAPRQDWIAGITFSSQGRRRAGFTTGAVAGGLGSEQIYVGLNLRMDLNLF